MSIHCARRTGVFSLAMLLGFSAQATTLDSIQGGILVSRGGSGYQMVSGPTTLRVGDSVLANPGGAARVVFDNGCTVSIRPGMVFTVADAPTCESGASNASGSGWSSYALPLGLAVVAGGAGLAFAMGGGGGGDDGGKVPMSAD